jgi:hypothetical protein
MKRFRTHAKTIYRVSPMVVVGLAMLWVHCTTAGMLPAVMLPVERAEAASVLSAGGSAPLASLARRDPLGLVHLAQERCEHQIRDYSCVFIRQEKIGDKLTPQQHIQVLYRNEPQSVLMKWIRNEGQVRRAVYVAGRLVDSDGAERALVEPSGALVRLAAKTLAIPIHGQLARASSRRTIDQFGFSAMFKLMDSVNKLALARGVLDIRYEGTGRVDGRPTYVLVRELPYAGAEGEFPDARLVLHLDQEWLLPVAIYSYADREEKELLGSYVLTSVKLNQDFDDDTFKF